MKILDYIKQKYSHLTGITFLIVPPEHDTKRQTKRIVFKTFMTWFSIYSAMLSLIIFLFVTLTPVKDIFTNDKFLTTQDERTIKEIKEKIISLTIELNKLKLTNERINGVIKKDTIKSNEQKKEIKAEGSILLIAKEFMFKLLGVEQEKYIFTKPVDGYISRKFDPEHGHLGIDYAVKNNTPVYSAANGYVIFADYTAKDGFTIIINHGKYNSIYKHCASLLKKEREQVQQGELIALSGNSGYSSGGPHLHFEIWKDNYPLDPLKYLSTK